MYDAIWTHPSAPLGLRNSKRFPPISPKVHQSEGSKVRRFTSPKVYRSEGPQALTPTLTYARLKWDFGLTDLRICGPSELWVVFKEDFSFVVLWTFGLMDLRTCGPLDLWADRIPNIHSLRDVKIALSESPFPLPYAYIYSLSAIHWRIV